MTNNNSTGCCPQAIKLLGKLEETFSLLADKGSSTSMTLEAVEEWLVRARVLDDQTVKKADLEDYFQKLGLDEMNFPHFQTMLKDLAEKKSMDVEKLSEQLNNAHNSSDTLNILAENMPTKDAASPNAVNYTVDVDNPVSGFTNDNPSSDDILDELLEKTD